MHTGMCVCVCVCVVCTVWSASGCKLLMLCMERARRMLTHMLRLVLGRHGVVHTQSLQELLLEDDVTEPETVGSTGDEAQKTRGQLILQQCCGAPLDIKYNTVFSRFLQ